MVGFSVFDVEAAGDASGIEDARVHYEAEALPFLFECVLEHPEAAIGLPIGSFPVQVYLSGGGDVDFVANTLVGDFLVFASWELGGSA